MTKRKEPWEAVKKGGDARLARFLLPAFPCAQIFIAREEERERDVWVGGRGHSVSKKKSASKGPLLLPNGLLYLTIALSCT